MSKETLSSLRTRGRRITPVRGAIVELFHDHTSPLSAQDVARLLEKKSLKANTTTVYRELQFLLEEKILQTVHFKDGVQRYERTELPHHHHLVCLSCNGVEDIHMDHDLASVENKIKKEKKFDVLHHALEFYGTCRKCS